MFKAYSVNSTVRIFHIVFFCKLSATGMPVFIESTFNQVLRSAGINITSPSSPALLHTIKQLGQRKRADLICPESVHEHTQTHTGTVDTRVADFKTNPRNEKTKSKTKN